MAQPPKQSFQYVPAKGDPSKTWTEDPVLRAEAEKQQQLAVSGSYEKFYRDPTAQEKLVKAQREYKPFSVASWEDFARGVGNGINNTGYSIYDLVGHGVFKGPTARELGGEIDYYGDQETAVGSLTSGITQFLVPFAGVSKAAKGARYLKGKFKGELKEPKELRYKVPAHKRIQKYLALATAGAAMGAAADFLAWHPEQGNFASHLNKWLEETDPDEIAKVERGMPGISEWIKDFAQVTVGPVAGVLAVDPVDPTMGEDIDLSALAQLETRFKNIGEGVFMGAGMNLMLHVIKSSGIRASARWNARKLRNHKAKVKHQTAASKDADGNSTVSKEALAKWDVEEKEILATLAKRAEQLKNLGADGALSQLRDEIVVAADWKYIVDGTLKLGKEDRKILELIEGWDAPPRSIEEQVAGVKFSDRVDVEYAPGKGKMRVSEVDAPKFDDWVKTSDDPAATALRNRREGTEPGDLGAFEGAAGEGKLERLQLGVEGAEDSVIKAEKDVIEAEKLPQGVNDWDEPDLIWYERQELKAVDGVVESSFYLDHPAYSHFSVKEWKKILDKNDPKILKKIYDDYIVKTKADLKKAKADLEAAKGELDRGGAPTTEALEEAAGKAYRATAASTTGKRVGASLQAAKAPLEEFPDYKKWQETAEDATEEAYNKAKNDFDIAQVNEWLATNPKYEGSPAEAFGKYKDKIKRGVRTLVIDEPQLREDFANKAWMNPQVEGVKPLGATKERPTGDPNMFKDAEDYIDWVLHHEKAHVDYPNPGSGVETARYENKINEIATERWRAGRRPDPVAYKGKVPETHEYDFINNSRTQQLVGSDGENILLDQVAVANDFAEGMAFMKGDGFPQGFNDASERERAIADFMNLDISKLKGEFINRSRLPHPGAGADIYGKFLELRQRRLLNLFEKNGIDLTNPKVSMHDIRIKRLLAEANYDTLTKDLRIDPTNVAGTQGGEMTRHGLLTERQSMFQELFVKENAAGESGITQIENLKKRMADPKDPLTLEILQESLASDKIFNLKLEAGGHASTDDSLAAFVHVFRDTFTSPSIKRGEEWLSAKNGWVPLDGADRKAFNRNKMQEKLTELALMLKDDAGNPMSEESLLRILKTGEGGFNGQIDRMSDAALKADIPDLSTGDAAELYARILGARQLFTSRIQAYDKAAAAFFKKRQEGTVSIRDMWDLREVVLRLHQDAVGLRHARRNWGREGLSFQDFDKMVEKGELTEEGVTKIVSDILNKFEFGGKKGEAAFDDMVETSTVLNKGKTGLKKSEEAAVTWDHLARGSISGFGLDIWISGLLGGLRTLSVNTIGSGMKAFTMPLGRIAGSYLNDKDQATILGRHLSATSANAYARMQGWKQFQMTAAMFSDFWRIMARTSDEGLKVADGKRELGTGLRGWARGGAGGPTQEEAFQATGAALRADNELTSIAPGTGKEGTGYHGEHGASGSPAQDWDRGSAEALAGGVANKLAYIPGVSREGGKNFVNTVVDHLNKTAGMDLMAGWNGMYHSTIKHGIRKMLMVDEMWKQVISRSYIKSSLAAHARVALGMTDNREIAEFVHRFQEGMIRPSGEIFSIKALKEEAVALYSKQDLDPSEMRRQVDLYVSKHKDIRDGGIVIMSAIRREEIASNIVREIREATFTSPLDQNAKEAFKARQARGEKGLVNPSEGGYGNISKYVQQLVGVSPISQYMTTPFVRTTSHLWREFGANQPFFKSFQDRYWADLYSGDASRVALAHGRQFIGSMIFGGAAVMAANGLIKGRGPSDPQARKNWIDQGNIPYSLVIPWYGYQVEFGRLDPLAPYLELAADVQENYYYARTDQEADFWVKDFAEAVAGGLGESLLNKTYTKDLAELYEIMLSTSEEDPTNRLEQWMRQKLTSTTPNILEGFGGSIDTKVRQIRSNMDALLVKMYPHGVPPKRHRIFGNIIERTEVYPNRFIHAFTPIKIHKPVKSDPFEIEMISLHGELQGMQSREWGIPYLDKTRFFAVTSPFKPEPAENEKVVPKWRNDQYNKTKKEMKWLRENFFKVVSGGKDNTPIKEGQDLYDLTSHYISVRKQEWVAPDRAGEILRAIEGKKGKEYVEIRKWANATLKGKVGHLTLKEILTAVIEHPSYKKISELPDEYAHVKSYRLEIIREIVQKSRNDAWEELIGERTNIAVKGSKHKNIVGRGGIVSAFYKDYAMTRVAVNRQREMWKQQQYQDEMPIGPDAGASTPDTLKKAIENIPR